MWFYIDNENDVIKREMSTTKPPELFFMDLFGS